jgi:hypothetical protein
MTKTHLAANHDQTIFSTGSLGQQPFYNWFVLIAYPKGCFLKKTIQPSGHTDQQDLPRNFTGDFAQSGRITLVNPGQGLGHVLDARDSFIVKQLHDFSHPGMIEFGDRHWVFPHCKKVA